MCWFQVSFESNIKPKNFANSPDLKFWTWLTCHLGVLFSRRSQLSFFYLSWQNEQCDCQKHGRNYSMARSHCQFITFITFLFTVDVIRQMAPLFSKFDSNKLWRDIHNEETVIFAKFGKDLFNISKVTGCKPKRPQFFGLPDMCQDPTSLRHGRVRSVFSV